MLAEYAVVISGFGAIEGPVVDASNNVWFSDRRNGVVYRRDAARRTHVITKDRPAVGGIALHCDGGVVISGLDVSHIRPDGSVRVLATLADMATKPGTVAIGFNDMEADGRGGLYAGVLRQDSSKQYAPGELIQITAPDEWGVVDGAVYPNGIALSQDGTVFFYADTFGRRICVGRPGGETPPAPLTSFSTAAVEGLPDGLAVDADGYIWVAFYQGRHVVRFSPDGAIDQTLEFPEHNVLSLCFSPSEDLLYVSTATTGDYPAQSGSILAASVGVRGASVAMVTL